MHFCGQMDAEYKSRTGYMELNTINKTGTWSETADRINSNFSKISIEVEEIKQNGGGGVVAAAISLTLTMPHLHTRWIRIRLCLTGSFPH